MRSTVKQGNSHFAHGILASVTLYSLYLHIPFCRHKCTYCDFNTYAGLEELIPDYVRALCREISLLAESAVEKGEGKLAIQTVFFGGGTPSRLPVTDVETLIRAIQSNFRLDPEAEITLEANPTGLEAGDFRAYHSAGVNRLSLGMQTARPSELALLGRDHDHFSVIQAVKNARLAGFNNLNLDLIYNLPGQSLDDWQESLQLALSLQPEHFSLYGLSLEHGTPMARWVEKGLVDPPDPDLGAEMYLWAAERLAAVGFRQYEISNWARIAQDRGELICRHNLQYWRNEPYLGLGAGAHGYAGGFRTANVLAPAAYILRCLEGDLQPFPQTPATVDLIQVDRVTEMKETLLMGLRLTVEGVSRAGFSARFGQDMGEVFAGQICGSVEKGLLEWAGDRGERLRLSERGRLLGNQVFLEFV